MVNPINPGYFERLIASGQPVDPAIKKIIDAMNDFDKFISEMKKKAAEKDGFKYIQDHWEEYARKGGELASKVHFAMGDAHKIISPDMMRELDALMVGPTGIYNCFMAMHTDNIDTFNSNLEKCQYDIAIFLIKLLP